MQDPDRLPLHEEVLLLALRAEAGTLERGAWFGPAAAGALLAELVLQGRLRHRKDGKKSTLEVARRKRVGHALLDEVLERIAADRKRRTVADWVGRVGRPRRLRARVAESLVQRGVLRAEERRVLFFFRRTVYPEVDPRPEREIRARLRRAVLERRAEVDERTALLVSLAEGTGLLKLVLSKEERAEHEERIEAIVQGEACGAAARDVVRTAAFVATISVAPIVVAGT